MKTALTLLAALASAGPIASIPACLEACAAGCIDPIGALVALSR